ncbi:MAG: hypothetical protein H0V17_14845 [Deltaproteobacteria bacterium]|nr:hypothetical protein [Deltaproteobacteria bacterium]
MRWLVVAVFVLASCKHKFDPIEARDIRATAIAVGARAPDAQLASTSGSRVALAEVLRGNAKTVLVFFRGFY